MFLSDSIGRGGMYRVLRSNIRARELFFHDGATMRRFHVSAKAQFVAVTACTVTVFLSLIAIANIALGTPAVASVVSRAISADVAVSRMSAKVAAMEAEMVTIRQHATDHAKRLEARQAALDVMVTGKGAMSAVVPASAANDSSDAKGVLEPLAAVELRQGRLAAQVTAMYDARYRATATALDRVGLDPTRFHKIAGATGGPYEPISNDNALSSNKRQADPQFRALFQSWKRLEQLQQGIVAIPSSKPTESVSFTSGFGVRSDPFRGGAAMHAGVDIPGPVGTPIYATADGIVARGEWANGYGNLVELDHGKGIQTRYGHLSAILVQPGQRVARGQLIARMGSTGRSTGSHLHYEVRLDGHAVNPMPFLQSANYLVAMQTRGNTAMGGPKGE